MASKEEIAAAAQALADQLIALAGEEKSRSEFNKLMLSAQDLLLMNDRLVAEAERGPDEYPDVLAPLFQVIYTGTDPVNYGEEIVEILQDGVPVGTIDPAVDVLPEPIPLPTSDGVPVTWDDIPEGAVEQDPESL